MDMEIDYYSIGICERSRMGKRFLMSMFVEDSKKFFDVYDKLGSDISRCAVRLVLCKDMEKNIKEGQETVRQIEHGSYIEVHMPPGCIAERIMEECKVSRLIIMDTPDLREKDEEITAYKADLVMLVVEKDIETEKYMISYQEWINEFGMWPCYGSAGIFFRIGWPCDESGNNVQAFIKEFQEKMIEEIRSIKGLSDKEMTKEAEVLIKELNRLGISEKDVVVLVRKIIDGCQYNETENKHNYTLKDFKEEKHDRVKSGDKNRISDSVDIARRYRLRDILMSVLKCEEAEWAQKWQQMVIEYVYHMLSSYVKKDIGIGAAAHHAETRPPVTMYAIEAMLAEDLLNAGICMPEIKEEGWDKYRNVMREYNVTNVINADINIDPRDNKVRDAMLKMELTVRCGIGQMKTHLCSDTIGYRYIMSLQKLGEYHIWETISSMHEITEEEKKNGYARQQMEIADYRGCLRCFDNVAETECKF